MQQELLSSQREQVALVDLPDIFKATIAAFHGIISTWLFLYFSETTVEEFQFIILLVFFSVANLIVWNGIKRLIRRGRARIARTRTKEPKVTLDLSAISYQPGDVLGLTLMAGILGLLASWAYRNDFVLKSANMVYDWGITHTDVPFYTLLSHLTGNELTKIDRRYPALFVSSERSYVRIWLGDLRTGYEGYPGVAPTKSTVNREMVLTPACRVSRDETDPLKLSRIEIIDGMGVFVALTDDYTIEILDNPRSPCAKLFEEANKRLEPVQRKATP